MEIKKMNLEIRKYTEKDLSEIIRIWNEVVDEGIAFPQEELLNMETGVEFFASQSFTGVAEEKGKELGFRVLQFNAVVENNIHARHLYERLGFKQLGTIPGGFRMKDGHYENICPYYHEL